MFNRLPGAKLHQRHLLEWAKGFNCGRVALKHTATPGTKSQVIQSGHNRRPSYTILCEVQWSDGPNSQNDSLISYPAGDLGPVQVFKQRNRIFPGDSGEVLEQRDGDSIRFHLLLP